MDTELAKEDACVAPLDCMRPFGLGGRMPAATHCCRPAVSGASDWSTLKLDAGRRRRTVGRRVEKAHGIAIEATLTAPAERLQPKAADSPFRPRAEAEIARLGAPKQPSAHPRRVPGPKPEGCRAPSSGRGSMHTGRCLGVRERGRLPLALVTVARLV